MKLIAGLGAVAQGLNLGLSDARQEEDRQRRIKNEEADRAYQEEARTQQRTQWERTNEEVERQKRIRDGVSKEGGEFKPEEIDLGVGNGGEPNTKAYRIDGRLFDSLDNPEAKNLLAELNSPLGQAKRMAMVHMKEGDYPGAQKVLADATRMTVDNFNLDKLKRTAEAEKANDAVMGAIFGEPGSNKFENAAKLATQTNLFGLEGKEIRPEVTADGKRVVMGVYSAGLDGNMTRERALATYPNDRAGVMALVADFSKGTPEQKMALYREIIAGERQAKNDETNADKEARAGKESDARIGLTNAHADYYRGRQGAETAAAVRATAAQTAQEAREWAAARKPSEKLLSLPSGQDGKMAPSTTLNAAYQQVLSDSQTRGMTVGQAQAEAASTIEGLKALGEARLEAEFRKNKKTTMTLEQAIRLELQALRPAGNAAPAPQGAAQPAPAKTAPARIGLSDAAPQDPIATMNVQTLRRIAAIPGHVNQRAAAARLAQIESESAANADRQMQENPQGFGLVPR